MGSSADVIGVQELQPEPAYRDFSAGLRDSHLDAGVGPGFTWGPGRLGFPPLGLLRIDYIFATPDFAAQQSTVDCNLRSDHCRLEAMLVRTN